MTDQTFLCPHCQKEIALTQALSHQLQDKMSAEYKKKYDEELAEKLKELQNEHELSQEKLQKQLEEKLRKAVDLEMKDKAAEAAELDKRNKEFQAQILELTKQSRELKKQNEEREMELQKKLAEGEDKIRQEVMKKSDEEHRFKELEYQKKLADVTAANDELRRKLEQGSQQTQGEILELDLETTLRSAFLDDEISPVEKGVRGADIQQVVKSPKGYAWGIILWEFKNTKVWTDGWTAKLKEDVRSTKAIVGVIVSTTLPKDSKSEMEERDGVWVCSPSLLLPLAKLIRQRILDVAFQKATSVNRSSKAEMLYEYVTGNEFKQQVEAIIEATSQMQTQITSERRAMERIWKEREGQITRIINSTSGVYGSMQGKVGSSLPPVTSLNLLSDGENDELLS